MVQCSLEINTVVRVRRVGLFAIERQIFILFVSVIKAIDALQVASKRYHFTFVSLLKVHLVGYLIEASHAR